MVKSVSNQYYEFVRFYVYALDLPHDHKTCTSTSNCDIHCGHEHHDKACIGGKCYCIGKHESGACDTCRRSTPVAFKWRGFEKKNYLTPNLLIFTYQCYFVIVQYIIKPPTMLNYLTSNRASWFC